VHPLTPPMPYAFSVNVSEPHNECYHTVAKQSEAVRGAARQDLAYQQYFTVEMN
jgi:hypothetical protein